MTTPRANNLLAPGAERWALWSLQAIVPDADAVALHALRARQRRLLGLEAAAMRRIQAGDLRLLLPGRRLLASRPELGTGLVLTVHLGPYQLLLEPFLAAGRTVTVLINPAARSSLKPQAEVLSHRLGHRGRIVWATLGEPTCMRQIVTGLRGQGPVIAFADGNQGTDGFAGTRERGRMYRLPGREIRLRDGLGRLACRLGCPVHPVTVLWTDEGGVVWRPGATQRWSRQDDPGQVAALMMDWAVHEISAAPHQWSYWQMVGLSAAAFGPGRDRSASLSPVLREDYARAFAICLERAPGSVCLELERAASVWPGDVLVDDTTDRFYAAHGLQDDELIPLREGRPTLAGLVALYGRAWVQTHGLRLCLLGLARLSWSEARA